MSEQGPGGRRILVTGLGTYWGSRIAQHLEGEPGVELVVGVDTRDPRLPLEKTEFVRADSSYSILQRIVRATQVDTIVHTHLLVETEGNRSRSMHEVNVIGTMNLLAAAGAAGSPVRKVVVKSSTLVYGSNFEDPFFFREDMPRTRAPRTSLERSLLEVSAVVRDFADDNPHVVVTKLRFANVLGSNCETEFSRLLRRSVVPEIAGFDPRLQFVHEDDVADALAHATLHDVPGIYNVAGDGVLPWSEVAGIIGKRRVPLPPILTGMAATPLRLLRVTDISPEVLSLLRYGRGVDTSQWTAAGYEYHYSTLGTVTAFAEALRLETTVGREREYRYERDVETFFRHSPAVVREPAGTEG
jgi:UDP-glucose 4-epimerase